MIVAQETQALDLGWTRGDAVSFSLRFKALAPLAGHQWTADIRTARDTAAELVAAFTVTASADTGDALVALTLEAVDNDRAGSFYWDLQSDDGAGAVRTWIGGRVRVAADVTDRP
jgi:hypothetical protein